MILAHGNLALREAANLCHAAWRDKCSAVPRMSLRPPAIRICEAEHVGMHGLAGQTLAGTSVKRWLWRHLQRAELHARLLVLARPVTFLVPDSFAITTAENTAEND